MITCTSCGHLNAPDDSFCGSCSAFLEWSGQPVSARVPAATATVPRDEEVADAAIPQARVPEAEQPRIAVQRRRHDGPTDLFCGDCGSGNAAGRRYCRHCGALLEDAAPEPEAALPWWRRLWAWLTRPVRGREPEPLAAGERPESWARVTGEPGKEQERRRWRLPVPRRISLGNLAIPLMILSLCGFGIAPVRAKVMVTAAEAYDDVRRVVAPRYVPVTAASASASSETKKHPAVDAVDRLTTTWWAEKERGTKPRLTVTFDAPVDIARFGVHNGAPGKDFAIQPRPRGVRLVFSGPGQPVVTQEFELKDTPKFQHLAVSAKGVRKVVLTVTSVYAGQRGSATSLTELQFIAKT